MANRQPPLGSGIPDWRERMVAATYLLVHAEGQNMAGIMRSKAPWKDRTANARQGLFATTSLKQTTTGAVITLSVGHSMEYGVYLETHKGPAYGRRRSMTLQQLMDPAYKGPLAIVWPTIDSRKPHLDAALQRLWSTPQP